MELIAFIVLAGLALTSAVVVVWRTNPVISALALALHLVSIAGLYLLLGAQFIALLQVIVYGGAIMVLILFVIMLLNLPSQAGKGSGLFQRWLAPALALGFVVVLGSAVMATAGGGGLAPLSPEFGTVSSVGRELFGTFFYAFEAISLLLVVAMVGAVLLAKKRL